MANKPPGRKTSEPCDLEPVFRKEAEIAPGQNGVPVHPAFGLPHMDLHVGSGNVFIMQADDFGNPQSGRIHDGKHRLVLQVTGRIEKPVDILT